MNFKLMLISYITYKFVMLEKFSVIYDIFTVKVEIKEDITLEETTDHTIFFIES